MSLEALGQLVLQISISAIKNVCLWELSGSYSLIMSVGTLWQLLFNQVCGNAWATSVSDIHKCHLKMSLCGNAWATSSSNIHQHCQKCLSVGKLGQLVLQISICASKCIYLWQCCFFPTIVDKITKDVCPWERSGY